MVEGQRTRPGMIPRAGRIVAVALLALLLACVAIAVSGGNGGGSTGRPAALLSAGGGGEQLVTISPTAFAYPQMSFGELAPVSPVLGQPVAVAEGSAQLGQQAPPVQMWNGGGAAQYAPVVPPIGGVQLAPVLSIDSVAAPSTAVDQQSKVSLASELRSEIEQTNQAEEMASLHELARRRREAGQSGLWAKGVEGRLSELQATESHDQAKIASDRARIHELEGRLSGTKAHVLSTEERQEQKVDEEEKKIRNLKSELAKDVHRVSEKTEEKETKGKKEIDEAPQAPSTSSSQLPLTDFVKMAKDNAKAITILQEKMRRLRLVSEGQYSILYKRLDHMGTVLKQQGAAADPRVLLQAQAAVRQGNTMVANKQAELQQQQQQAAPVSEAKGFSESFNTERLFGGYHLSGGSHPGEELTTARNKWIDNEYSKASHVDVLAEKRKVIRHTLDQMALGDVADATPVGSVGEMQAPVTGEQRRQQQTQHKQHGQREQHGERDEARGSSFAKDRERESSKAPPAEASRAEEGFQKAAHKNAARGIHPEGMHGSVYRHFMHELQGEEAAKGRGPMLFDAAPARTGQLREKPSVMGGMSAGFTGVGL